MTTWKPPAPGVLDDGQWSETLTARAILTEPTDDRVHGYAVLGDLVRHYSYADMVYLSITGELPTERGSRLFHVGLASYATLAVNEAPGHVGILCRVSGGTLASALGAGAIAIADQARAIVQSHQAFLAWAIAPAGDAPAEFRTAVEDPWVRRLVDTIPDAALVRPDLMRDAARLAVFCEAGLRVADHIEAAIVAARMCGLTAEVLATGPRDLNLYPVKLPPFHYVEEVTR